jgi:hypothetical protein
MEILKRKIDDKDYNSKGICLFETNDEIDNNNKKCKNNSSIINFFGSNELEWNHLPIEIRELILNSLDTKNLIKARLISFSIKTLIDNLSSWNERSIESCKYFGINSNNNWNLSNINHESWISPGIKSIYNSLSYFEIYMWKIGIKFKNIFFKKWSSSFIYEKIIGENNRQFTSCFYSTSDSRIVVKPSFSSTLRNNNDFITSSSPWIYEDDNGIPITFFPGTTLNQSNVGIVYEVDDGSIYTIPWFKIDNKVHILDYQGYELLFLPQPFSKRLDLLEEDPGIYKQFQKLINFDDCFQSKVIIYTIDYNGNIIFIPSIFNSNGISIIKIKKAISCHYLIPHSILNQMICIESFQFKKLQIIDIIRLLKQRPNLYKHFKNDPSLKSFIKYFQNLIIDSDEFINLMKKKNPLLKSFMEFQLTKTINDSDLIQIKNSEQIISENNLLQILNQNNLLPNTKSKFINEIIKEIHNDDKNNLLKIEKNIEIQFKNQIELNNEISINSLIEYSKTNNNSEIIYQSTNFIEYLPKNCIIKIINFLYEECDLLNLRLVCKSFKYFLDRCDIWKTFHFDDIDYFDSKMFDSLNYFEKFLLSDPVFEKMEKNKKIGFYYKHANFVILHYFKKNTICSQILSNNDYHLDSNLDPVWTKGINNLIQISCSKPDIIYIKDKSNNYFFYSTTHPFYYLQLPYLTYLKLLEKQKIMNQLEWNLLLRNFIVSVTSKDNIKFIIFSIDESQNVKLLFQDNCLSISTSQIPKLEKIIIVQGLKLIECYSEELLKSKKLLRKNIQLFLFILRKRKGIFESLKQIDIGQITLYNAYKCCQEISNLIIS